MTDRTLIALNILLMLSNAASSAPEIGVRREPPIKWIGDNMDRQAITEDLGKAEEALRTFSLAVVAAGQYANEPQISRAQYMEIVSSRGKADYRLCGAVVGKLAESYPLTELIMRASQPGFSDWAAAALSFS